MAGKTLYDKLWDQHLVRAFDDGTGLLYIDRHIAHEVTSPQAFEGLELAQRPLWRTLATKAVSDHNVPTVDVTHITDPVARVQLETLTRNCARYGILHHDIGDVRQGIVHVTGPEQGWSLPGMTIVCGDSHTATNGALAALAFGIGTSEIEHVLATQCLVLRKAKNMRITVSGSLGPGVTAKDVILHIIGHIGTAGATGHTMEYDGAVIRGLSMEGRMTVCNMSIEAGGRAGLIAFDDVTRDYVRGRPYAPNGAQWERALASWQDLHSDADARFDTEYSFEGAAIEPQVSWGTSPEMVVPVHARVRIRRQSRMKRAASACRMRWPTWPSSPARASPTSPSTRSSSARAPIPASRTCAPRQPWSRDADARPRSRPRWSCRARDWSNARPRPKVSIAFSSRPASNGVNPVVRCVSA